MFAFFDAIAHILLTVINFVVSSVEMLLNLLRILFKGAAFLFALIPNLPSFCMSFILVMIAIAILIQILNKGG